MPKIHDLEVDDYLLESVAVDEIAQLDSEMRRISSDLCYWNSRFATAHKDHLISKVDLDRKKAHLYIEHRERLHLTEKKVTESMVDSAVDMDERYIDARIGMIEADAERLRTKGVCEAVAAKKDMLQSIGAKLRLEMAADPTVRDLVTGSRLVGGV